LISWAAISSFLVYKFLQSHFYDVIFFPHLDFSNYSGMYKEPRRGAT